MSIVKLHATNKKVVASGSATFIKTPLNQPIFITSADLITYQKKTFFGGEKEAIFPQITLIHEGVEVKAKVLYYKHDQKVVSLAPEFYSLVGNNFAVLTVDEVPNNFPQPLAVAQSQQLNKVTLRGAGILHSRGKSICDPNKVVIYNATNDISVAYAGCAILNDEMKCVGIVHSISKSYIHIVEDIETKKQFLSLSMKECKRKVSAIGTPIETILHELEQSIA